MNQILSIFVSVLIGLCYTSIHAEDVLVLCYHDVRDSVKPLHIDFLPGKQEPIYPPESAEHLDPDQFAISTHNLAAHFDWLRSHGFHVISLQQLIDARTGQGTLPSKPVLLTFDDGLTSVYTKVFPLLRAFRYPAVVAVVGVWTNLPADGQVDYGPRIFTRKDFATWSQLREMQNSGLVEIASHTYDLHQGILSNPQSNKIPAVIMPAFDSQRHHYETDEEYQTRIRADLSTSTQEIRSQLGCPPRAIMWPYGEYTEVAEKIASSLGMTVSFTLSLPQSLPGRSSAHSSLREIPRQAMTGNPDLSGLIEALQHVVLTNNVRAVQVDLDYIYDPDPAQQERNLSVLLNRIKSMNITQVWLQAFADPDGTGSAGGVYFPSRTLPVRADLFSRVAWQLRTRSFVNVYAWMPMMAFRLPDKAQQMRLEIRPKPGAKPATPVRLNPFLPETRRVAAQLYEEMARSAPIAGILFHDDGILLDTDDLGSGAPPPGLERTMALISYTKMLTEHVKRWRPEVSTARNLFVEPILHPESESWYAQSLPAFLNNYDEVALMAMPYLENARDPTKWLARLEGKVAAVPGGLDRTVFELQAEDWHRKKAVPTRKLAGQMRQLQNQGVRHLAYYPDDFLNNSPNLKELMPVFSVSAYPALRP